MGLTTLIRLLLNWRDDLNFPEGRVTFAWKYLKWRYKVRFSLPLMIDSEEKLTIVLLSYKRPQNIEPIVRSALACGFVDKLIVCNNNPEFPIEEWVRVSDCRLVLLNQMKNMGWWFRFDIARSEQGNHFLFIDDDIFLYPEQIKLLFLCLLKDPAVPHGVRGQILLDGNESLDGIYGIERTVDIINGVYAFTKAHLSEYFRLHKELQGLPMADDIVLSFTGESAPSCHNVGDVLMCPTERATGVAVWKQPDFLIHRTAALQRLVTVKRLARSAISLPALSGLPLVTTQCLFTIDTLNGHTIGQEKEPIVISQYKPHVVVNGWAVDARLKDLAGGVYIKVDGELYPSIYGGDRPDVAAHFGVAAYRRSGFQASIWDIKPGVHMLSIVVLTKDQKAYYEPENTVTFQIFQAEWSEQAHSPIRRTKEAYTERPVRIRLMRNYYSHWAEHSGAHQFANHVNGPGFEFHHQVVPLGFDRFQAPGFQDRLRRFVKKSGVQYYDLNNLRAEFEALLDSFNKSTDVIHCLDGEFMQYLPPLMKRMRRIKQFPKLIASFHQPPEILSKVINKDIVRLLDHVLVYCRSQASFFEQFMNLSQIAMVPHGIDTAFFRPGIRKPANTFKCLTVGFWLRDFNTIWNVTRKMLAYPDIEFHLVTPRQEPPEHLSNVKIHQNLSDKALLNLYQESDVLFIPLLEAGANNAILEAAACGLPIVSNSVGGVPDYTDKSFADLVSSGDVDGFSNVILRLRSDPDMRHQMGQAARLFVERHFAWPKVTEQMLDVYEKVLEPRTG
jgi:glycosyltransferase involved in cell wall biosynthesis